MAISNIDKKHLNELIKSVSSMEITNNNDLEKIKSNSAYYAQLKLISKQMEALKVQANDIINEAIFNNTLHTIECKFNKTPGNYYYLYKNNDKMYFSLLSIKDWNNNPPHEYLGEYYYDFDRSLNKV